MEQAGGTAWQGRGVGATLAVSMLLASLGTSIANVALPDLARAFSAPFPDMQAVVVAYLAAMTLAMTLAGRLGDRRGSRPMLLLGLWLFFVASLLCALAPSLPVLVAGRALQGTGAAFLATLSTALMRRTASPARVGRAMGLLGTMSALGTALGPSLGGLVVPVLGWRGVFWIEVPLAAAALALAFARLPAEARSARTRGPRLRAVLDAKLGLHLLLNAVVAAVMMTTLVVAPFYLGFGLGLSTPAVGAVMTVGPVISTLSGVPSGRLVDRRGSGPVLAIGLGLVVAGALLLALLPNAVGALGFALSVAVLTPGYQLFQAANTTAALAETARDRQATVSGLLGLARNLGLIAGAAVMGAVFAWAVGTGHFAEAGAGAIAGGMRLTFLLAAALTALSAGLALRKLGRLNGRRISRRG